MTAFADHNKDYFRANYNAFREELAKIPTNLDGYSTEPQLHQRSKRWTEP